MSHGENTVTVDFGPAGVATATLDGWKSENADLANGLNDSHPVSWDRYEFELTHIPSLVHRVAGDASKDLHGEIIAETLEALDPGEIRLD